MKNNNKGYTLIELLIAIVTGTAALTMIGGLVAIAYVAFHFLSKIW